MMTLRVEMRLLRLTEYEPQLEELTKDELHELVASRLVGVRPEADGRYRLTPENIVGTVVGRHLRLLIRPKIGVRNVFFLMSYATGLARWRAEERFPYSEDEDLFK